ncbi:MAG: hypothetical protein ACPLX7_10120 [Candidatus Kapaibacteriota bacterium]
MKPYDYIRGARRGAKARTPKPRAEAPVPPGRPPESRRQDAEGRGVSGGRAVCGFL